MDTVEKDDIQKIRQDVLAIQDTVQLAVREAVKDAFQSILSRIDVLSSNAGNAPVSQKLSAEDAKRQWEILESGDGWAAYKFARDIPGADIKALQHVVLEQRDGVAAYHFAKNIAGADIRSLQQVMLERGDGLELYVFAKDVHGADLQELHKRLVELHSTGDDIDTCTGGVGYLDDFNANVGIQTRLKAQLERNTAAHEATYVTKDDLREQDIIARGDVKAAYQFARDVMGADIQALQQVVLMRGDAGALYCFARDVDDADLTVLHKRLVELHSVSEDIDILTGVGGYLDIFNKDADIQARLKQQMDAVGQDTDASVTTLSAADAERQRDIVESGDGWRAYFFAGDVPGADIQALQKVITDHGDGRAAYYFAKDINGTDIKALQQVVIERGSGEYAYRFARDIPGADIQALQQVVLERGDGWDVYHFALNVVNADLVELHNRLVKLNSTGDDINSETGTGHYLDKFNKDPDIQDRLKAQLDAAGHSEPERTTSRKKHRPSRP